MNKKKRLLELLYKYELIDHEAMSRHDYDSDKAMEACADFLLTNGVLVLPCNIGDALYFPMRRQVIQYHVTMIRVREEGVKITCTNDKAMLQMTIDEDHIGKTIFRTYEEAEKAAGIGRADNG